MHRLLPYAHGFVTAALLLGTPAVPAQPVAARSEAPTRLEPPVQGAPGNLVFLASGVIPGSGQYLMGDHRWVAYAAVEVWSLVSFVQQRRAGRSLQQRYRDLAWQVPRRVSVGERRDTTFEYYEAMAHHAASGVFDREPLVPGIQPENLPGTFNGNLWALALALHGNPTALPGSEPYQRALEYYTRRAITDSYAWAWGEANLERQVFVDLITESDDAFRSATQYAGLILANHIASAVDALISTRLRQLGGGALRIESGAAPDAIGVRWDYGLRIRF